MAGRDRAHRQRSGGPEGDHGRRRDRPARSDFEIVPENSDLIIGASIRTEDINYVRPGVDADVLLIAFKQPITPVVEGKVVYVSADRLLDKTVPSSLPYYAVHIRVTPEALKKAGDLSLHAGTPAEVFIKSTSRTTLQYFFDPITAYLRRSMREP